MEKSEMFVWQKKETIHTEADRQHSLMYLKRDRDKRRKLWLFSS